MKNVIVNADTDSIMIAEINGASWSEEQQEKFLSELNAQLPEKITFEHDGMYDAVLVMKSKNYALLPEGEDKIKTKGSSIRDQKKEPAMREMMDTIIKIFLKGDPETRHEDLTKIYKSYVLEAMNVKDISRWCTKKTLTESIFDCKGYTQADIKSKKLRKNETDVWDAVKDQPGIQMGDKVYLYSKLLKTITIPGGVSEKTGKPLKDKEENIYGLEQSKNWKNDHDVESLIDRCFATLKIFKEVLDIEQFTDYTKKKNKEKLQELIDEAL